MRFSTGCSLVVLSRLDWCRFDAVWSSGYGERNKIRRVQNSCDKSCLINTIKTSLDVVNVRSTMSGVYERSLPLISVNGHSKMPGCIGAVSASSERAGIMEVQKDWSQVIRKPSALVAFHDHRKRFGARRLRLGPQDRLRHSPRTLEPLWKHVIS